MRSAVSFITAAAVLVVSALASPAWQPGYYQALSDARLAEQRANEAAARAGNVPAVVPAQAGSAAPGASSAPGGSGLPFGFVAPIPGAGACQWTCPGGDSQFFVPCAQTQLCGGQCDPRVCANSLQSGVDCAYLQSQLPPVNCG